MSGLGAGLDSFYEYLLKVEENFLIISAAVLFDAFVDLFADQFQSKSKFSFSFIHLYRSRLGAHAFVMIKEIQTSKN